VLPPPLSEALRQRTASYLTGSTTLEGTATGSGMVLMQCFYTPMASRKGRYHGWQASEAAYQGGALCREDTCRQNIGDDAKQLQQAISAGESWRRAAGGMVGALYTCTGLTSARGSARHSEALKHRNPTFHSLLRIAQRSSRVCSINYVQQIASETDV